MYPASADFHNAVKNGNPQMPLLIFPGIASAEKSYSAGSFIHNTWVNTSNVVYEANNAKTCIVPAIEGEIFTLTADVSASSTYVYLIVFLDDSNTVLKRNVATSGNSLSVVAPANSTKCIAGFYNYDTSGITMPKLKNYGKFGVSSPSVFTAEDIDINAGIEFDDLFNTEENTAIGQALMNNIRFTLFNDNQLLNDYEFGQFIATIGVLISESTYTQQGTISVSSDDNTYVATSSSPYLTRNGSALADPPTGKIANILIYDGKVYAFRDNGFLYIYDDATGDRIYATGKDIFNLSIADWVTGYYIDASGAYVENSNYKYSNHFYEMKPDTKYIVHFTRVNTRSSAILLYNKNKQFITRRMLATSSSGLGTFNLEFTTTDDTAYMRIYYGTNATEDYTIKENASRFMKNKFMQDRKYGACLSNNILTINQNGVSKTYEFVPLGTFLANRPDAPSVSQINMSCDDQMKKFDRNLPDDTTLGITYPTTIGNLYKKMCEYLDVPYETDTFINSTATIAKRPAQFESVTMRQVLQWIAEAAGSNAKFNRDGVLCLLWLNTTTAEFDEGDYSAFSPFWYETQQVDKLYNRNSQGGEDGIYGSGNGGYLILDNPLMKGAN